MVQPGEQFHVVSSSDKQFLQETSSNEEDEDDIDFSTYNVMSNESVVT